MIRIVFRIVSWVVWIAARWVKTQQVRLHGHLQATVQVLCLHVMPVELVVVLSVCCFFWKCTKHWQHFFVCLFVFKIKAILLQLRTTATCRCFSWKVWRTQAVILAKRDKVQLKQRCWNVLQNVLSPLPSTHNAHWSRDPRTTWPLMCPRPNKGKSRM